MASSHACDRCNHRGRELYHYEHQAPENEEWSGLALCDSCVQHLGRIDNGWVDSQPVWVAAPEITDAEKAAARAKVYNCAQDTLGDVITLTGDECKALWRSILDDCQRAIRAEQALITAEQHPFG